MSKASDDYSEMLPDTIPQWLQDMVHKHGRDPDKYSKLERFFKETDVVATDKFDRLHYNNIREMASELNEVATERWSDDPTWFELIKDTYLGLYKARPKQNKSNDMRPDYALNWQTFERAAKSRDWPELRAWTELDQWAAAMATAEFGVKLSEFFDEQKELKELQDEANEAAKELQEKLQEGQSTDDADKFLDSLEEAMEQYETATDGLGNEVGKQASGIHQAARQAAEGALGDAESSLEMLSAFGTDAGDLKRIPHEARMELANRIRRNSKLKELADKVGRFVRFAMGEQARKIVHGVDEVHDVELGADIHRALPSELALLADEDTEILFLRKFVERELLQYQLRGTEKVARGAIIAMIDTSGSMYGERETWAKAISIALLNVARKQNRAFYGILFGSAYDPLVEFQFEPKKAAARVRSHKGEIHRTEYNNEIEAVLDFAEYSFGGGTDFQTPIDRAVEVLRRQYDESSAQKGDLIMITDGECSVSNDWIAQYEKEKDELAYRHYGCLIGVRSATLETLCDDIYSVSELGRADNAGEMFSYI